MQTIITVYFGARPIICLKSTTKLKKQSDSEFLLVERENTDNYITAENLTTSDYGGYVTNYVDSIQNIKYGYDYGSAVDGWRIFHSDGDNIYLIADNYTIYRPNGKNGTQAITNDWGDDGSGIYWTTHNSGRTFSLTPYKDYAGTTDINSGISSKWLKQYTSASTNINARATAYLLDKTAWSGFKDGNGYADYVIGAPTLELYVDSYNATHNSKIELNADTMGYKVKWSGDADYNRELSGINVNDYLYTLNYTGGWRLGMWLASPSSYNSESMMCITYDGRISYVNYNYYDDPSWLHYKQGTFGARPIICLKSSVKLEKVGYMSYRIVD